jgi:hypothetical protein
MQRPSWIRSTIRTRSMSRFFSPLIRHPRMTGNSGRHASPRAAHPARCRVDGQPPQLSRSSGNTLSRSAAWTREPRWGRSRGTVPKRPSLKRKRCWKPSVMCSQVESGGHQKKLERLRKRSIKLSAFCSTHHRLISARGSRPRSCTMSSGHGRRPLPTLPRSRPKHFVASSAWALWLRREQLQGSTTVGSHHHLQTTPEHTS